MGFHSYAGNKPLPEGYYLTHNRWASALLRIVEGEETRGRIYPRGTLNETICRTAPIEAALDRQRRTGFYLPFER